MGNDDLENVKIDSICETIRDFKDEFQKIRRSGDEIKMK
jgi:uncharacterized membrane protein (DUF106 family)